MTDDTTQREWTPQFEGQRAPFEKDNELAMKHGARSPRRVEEMAKKILNDELYTRYEHLREFPEAVTSLARNEAVTRMLFTEITRNGITGKDGDVRARLLASYNSGERTGALLRKSLGMTPESEAAVARDRAAAASSSVDVVGELVRLGRATRAQNQTEAEVPESIEAAPTEGENDAHR